MNEEENEFLKAANAYQKEADDLFQSLPYDDQLKVFCAVVKKIAIAEIDNQRSYRGVLYDEFQFDLDSYAVAQHAGYLDLHNSIFNFDDLVSLVKKFVSEKMDITNDDLDAQVRDYISKRQYY